MSNLKKIVFFTFVFTSLGLAIWAYFSLKKLKSPKIEAITVMPEGCDFYLNTSDFYELSNRINSQNLIVDRLKGFVEVKEACELLHHFDSIFSNQEILKEELKDNLIHFAFYENYQQWLLCFNTLQSGNQDNVLHQLHLILNEASKKEQYFVCKIKGKTNIYFNLMNGIVCFSNNENIIKKTFSDKDAKFFQSESYKYFKNTLNENELCNVFVNTKQNKSKKNQNSQFFDEGLFAGTLELEPSEIKINGNLWIDSSNIFSALRHEAPQSSSDFLPMLPYNTNYFEAFGFESYANVRNNLKTFKDEALISFWRDKNEKALYNLENEFNENISGHIVQFERGLDNEKFIAVLIKDTTKAIDCLKLICDSTVQTKNHMLYNFKSNTLQALFMPLFDFKINCFALNGNVMYFGTNINNLDNLLNELDRNQSIVSNENFLKYKNKNISDDINYLVYSSPRIYEKNISKRLHFKNVSKQNPFENLRHFSYSVVNDKNTMHFRLQIFNQAVNEVNEQNALWAFNIDTTSSSEIYSFVNHLTGANEITFQDDKNQLYLINAKGSQLWKKELAEKIMSPIYTVDIYKNNKLQLMFNTATYLYLIDRNGNDVKGYPVKLPAKASSALSLLDYNQDNDYRIFIACTNNLIYDINKEGKLQEGFVPVKTEKLVKLPVQYFKIGSAEYLVALDVEGKIYTFGRKGQTKITLKNRTIQDCKSFYINVNNNLASSSLIYYDDKNSLINKVNFIDKKDVVKLNIESSTANNSFGLVDDNQEPDLVISQNNLIFAFNLTGDLLQDFKTNNEIDQAVYYGDENNSVYFCLNKIEQEVELYDVKKQKIKKMKSKNLPMVLDLFNDNKKYMILNNGNQLSCVELN